MTPFQITAVFTLKKQLTKRPRCAMLLWKVTNDALAGYKKGESTLRYQRTIIIAIVSLMFLWGIGIVGYAVIEKNNPHGGWTVFDAIFMTAITLTTVGYGDYNMSNTGKLFTIVLLIGGVGVFAYGISVATAFIVEGQLREVFQRKRMEKAIDKLSNHYIICGIGDTGIHVLDELIHTNVDLVAVEGNQTRIDHLLETRDFLYVHGDSTDDEVLIRAGVQRARGLIASLSTDRDNLFVVLSAKQLNPKLRVVSKAVEANSQIKLRKAGADSVVLSDQIGGLRLASTVMRPHVVDFLDIMLKHQVATRFAESVIQAGSDVVGRTLGEVRIPEQMGLVVVAVRAREGHFIYNPPAQLKLNAGDALIIIADNNQLAKLNKLTEQTL